MAFVNVLRSSGLRRAECGSLLTFEVPGRRLDGGRYYVGKVAAAATRSKKARTFYVASSAIGDVETYMDASRALAIRGAQRMGRYERLPEVRIVTEVTRGLKPMVHWVDRKGSPGRITKLKKTIANKNERLTRLEADVPALVRTVHILTLENQDLREQLTQPHTNVVALRPHPDHRDQ
ncbi:MAG: phage integrase-like protein [Actinoallomurus sp.]|nr:phage integrase-like protein [Actinoallomurus sp.]